MGAMSSLMSRLGLKLGVGVAWMNYGTVQRVCGVVCYGILFVTFGLTFSSITSHLSISAELKSKTSDQHLSFTEGGHSYSFVYLARKSRDFVSIYSTTHW